jgi:WASH complex subunit strumpellin
MDFLTESLCGKDFLKLLARGSGILAELLRLSNNIPKIFLTTDEENQIYKDLLFDFDYLRDSDAYEDKVAKIPDYEKLEESLFERYSVLIKRFMDLFESIISYASQLNKLMRDINEGNSNYVENLEMLLSADVSKQVMLESYYFLGVMLIFLENLIPGPVRERIVICHVRIIGGQNTLANLHEITKLCKKTGFLPQWYPHEERKSAVLNIPSATIDKKIFTEFSFTEKMFARMNVDSSHL